MPEYMSVKANKAASKVSVSSQADSISPILDLPDDVIKEIKDYIVIWMNFVKGEHLAREEIWKKHEDQYRAVMPTKRSFPFEGASRIVVQVTAMAVDPIYSRLITGVFGQKPVFVGSALKKDFLEVRKPVEDFVEYYIRNVALLRDECKQAYIELVNLGTAVFKVCREKQVERYKTYGADGQSIVDGEQVVYDGPKAWWLPLGDFFIPEAARDVESAPLVAHRFRASWPKLKALEYSGKYGNLEAIKNFYETSKTNVETSRDQNDKVQAAYIREHELYEIWFDYDTKRTGQVDKLVATFHLDALEFIQLRYNWYFHQKRPFVVIPYFPKPGSIYGMGIAEMTEGAQEEITTMHRQRSDNATLANVRMYVAKRGSPGIERVPRIFPGRTFFVDDPKNDFIPFAAAEVYPSSVTEEQMLFGYVEKRTGVSDYLVGRESPLVGSRATATSTLALIQEGTKRVEQTLQELRGGMEKIQDFFMEIWAQYGVGDLPLQVLGPEIGEKVAAFFNQPNRLDIVGSVGFELALTSAAQSKEIQKQTALSLIQILQAYYDRLLNGAMVFSNPQVPELVKKVMVSIAMAQEKLMKQTTELFDVRNLDEMIPNLEALLGLADQLNGAGTGRPAGAGQDSQGLPPGGGVEAGASGASGSPPNSAAQAGDGGRAGSTPILPGFSEGA